MLRVVYPAEPPGSAHHGSMGWSRGVLVVGSTALVVGSVAGCAVAPTACSAIGWANAVDVTVTGNTAAVAQVRACAGDGCDLPTQPTPGAATARPETLPQPSGTPVPGGVRWRTSTDMSTPEHGEVTVLDADGRVLTTQRVDLTWVGGGSPGPDHCGGPSTAAVTVAVPG